MADVLFLAILTAFFALCVGFVRLCDRMIQHSDTSSEGSGTGDTDDDFDPLEGTKLEEVA